MTRLAATFIFLSLLVSGAIAGPGHDHGDAAGAAAPAADVPRLESTGSELELVATAEGHTLTIYLDRLATNEPVSAAKIDVSGEGIAATAKEKSDGIYEIEGDWLDEPGTKALVFTASVGDTIDLLNGTLDIRATETVDAGGANAQSITFSGAVLWAVIGLAAAAGFFFAFMFRPLRIPADDATDPVEAKQTDKPGSLKSLRHAAEIILIGVLLHSAAPNDALAGPGHDHGDGGHVPSTAAAGGNVPRKLADGGVFVPKPSQRLLKVRTAIAKSESAKIGTKLIGTVIPDPASAGQVQAPMDGQVELSDRGISFVGQTVEAGEVLATLAPTIPVFERGSLQQLTADVEGKLRIAEQRLSRLTRIAGVVAQRDIDDTKAELDALREQKRVLAPKSAEKLLLKAPVSGVISIATVRPGQVVTARDTLFEIVDPKRLWVEAVGSNAHDTTSVTAAHAVDSDGHAIELSYVGQSPTLRQQSLPLLFQIKTFHSGLAIGSTVKVLTQRDAAQKGVIVPEAAVVRGANGLPQVWIKESPERFRPSAVRTLPLDGSRVLVIAGIEDGSRVVTEGAEFINQIR